MGENLIYQLLEEMEYTKNGEFCKTVTLEFRTPLMDEFDLSSDLAQLVMGALMDAGSSASGQDIEKAQENSDAGFGDIKPHELRVVLLSSQKIKFKDTARVFKKLAIKTGTFEGTEPLTEDKINTLSQEDFISLVCTYIANFTLPSLFSGEG